MTRADLTPRQVSALLAFYRRAPFRYVIGCERCNVICNIAGSCSCCRSRSAPPDDGKGHYRICTYEELLKGPDET